MGLLSDICTKGDICTKIALRTKSSFCTIGKIYN